MVEVNEFKPNAVGIETAHHTHPWRTLFSGSSEVGIFRLKTGTDYLERKMEFRPLAPIQLKESTLGGYLERELKACDIEIDNEGGIHVRLGPHKKLSPVLRSIAWTYSRFLRPPKKSEVTKNEVQTPG